MKSTTLQCVQRHGRGISVLNGSAAFFAAVAALASLACFARVATAAENFEQIERRLTETSAFLASDELKGRGLGSEGLETAARYVAEQFAQIGLKTELLDGSPFQKFQVTTDVSPGTDARNRLAFHGRASTEGGQHSLIRFYTLHCVFLPVLATAAVAVHIWRIRKDGGLARPEGTPTPAGKGAPSIAATAGRPEESPRKSYGLMCVVRDRSPHTGKDPDETVPSWPYLLRVELLVFMVVMLVCVALGYLFDAPLREAANPALPENPAKAPWYFLGLQEMVSYSAFVSGIVIPVLTVVGLGLIPFLDREREPSGVWFSGPRGRRVGIQAAIFGSIAAVLTVAVPVNFGWLRNWFPEIPQLMVIIVNPGTLLTAAYVAWSLIVMRKTRSTRMGAIALFTCFVMGFAILTYVGTYLRGPNWDFYWSSSQWPGH